VNKGQQYEIAVSANHYTSVYSMQLYSRAFKLFGKSISMTEWTLGALDTAVFTAKHDGLYYLNLNLENEGFFIIVMKTVYNVTDSPTTLHFNIFYLFAVLSPAFLFLAVYIYAIKDIGKFNNIKKIYRDIEKKTRPKSFKCPECGTIIEKNTEYCKICGHTFKVPDHQVV
jgi:predicted RNA-binding Zn-ribbon protein involved in translation (DUF1610 family)